MTLWLIFAVLTAAAMGAVVWPLLRPPRASTGGSDRYVYQDQLREIDRDRAAGLIAEPEAQSARVEIARRLLTAAAAEPSGQVPAAAAVRLRGAIAVAAVLLLPAVAVSFYITLGSPAIPVQSALTRVKTPTGTESIAQLVGKVEAHLAQNPNDGRGWELIAPVFMQLGRFGDAVVARQKAIALNGDTPMRESDLGDALVAAANGVVTDDAKRAFQRALAGDAQDAKARYFLGLADEQDGNREAAAAKWRALLDSAPPDAPWAGFVRAALARVIGDGPRPAASDGPDAHALAAAANMSEAQRREMIGGMIQRLADRLRSDGNDVDGWVRLVRAYAVLGDRDKAKGAAADARRALQGNPENIKQIDALVRGLGLDG